MSLLMLMALLLDEWLGEAKRFHPLVGFGLYVSWLESKLRLTNQSPAMFLGGIAWLLAVSPFVILCVALVWLLPPIWLYGLEVVALYFSIGQKSLKQHGRAVALPLLQGDLTSARRGVAMIVSRDTKFLDATQISKATVETVTENTHDAIIAPLFYFLVLGLPGIVVFRLANTLDAMWGYRNEQYEYFGKCSARIDDVLGFIPARITALLMLLARPQYCRQTLKSIWYTGRNWYSPNAGMVMAAGAGALNIRLGGNAVYHGKEKTDLSYWK